MVETDNSMIRQGEMETVASGEQGVLTRRPSLDAWVHDRVAQTVARQAIGFAAYTNVDGHHSVCLTGNFREACPDVILCDPESSLVDHVIEVEVDESIHAKTAQRWLDVAHAVPGRGHFWILVPPSAVASAAQLCQRYGIAARIGTWHVQGDDVTIAWPVPLTAAPILRF